MVCLMNSAAGESRRGRATRLLHASRVIHHAVVLHRSQTQPDANRLPYTAYPSCHVLAIIDDNKSLTAYHAYSLRVVYIIPTSFRRQACSVSILRPIISTSCPIGINELLNRAAGVCRAAHFNHTYVGLPKFIKGQRRSHIHSAAQQDPSEAFSNSYLGPVLLTEAHVCERLAKTCQVENRTRHPFITSRTLYPLSPYQRKS